MWPFRSKKSDLIPLYATSPKHSGGCVVHTHTSITMYLQAFRHDIILSYFSSFFDFQLIVFGTKYECRLCLHVCNDCTKRTFLHHFMLSWMRLIKSRLPVILQRSVQTGQEFIHPIWLNITKDTVFRYTKTKLAEAYKTEGAVARIASVMLKEIR